SPRRRSCTANGTPMLTELAAAFQGLSWNPFADVRQLLLYHFMVNALVAGTAVAVLAGSIGWFVVLRRQTFAGHTLAVIAFPGAAGATLAGLPLLLGYFGACVAGAIALAGVAAEQGGGHSRESAATGTVQAVGLGLGFLFVQLYHGLLNGLQALLFGTFLGITDVQARTLVAVTAVTLVVLALAARPLFFASVDAVFALLVTPAATAHRLTSRPVAGLVLSVVLGLAVTWLGLALAYFSIYPVGF